jgi:tol-pal system protein YbgF
MKQQITGRSAMRLMAASVMMGLVFGVPAFAQNNDMRALMSRLEQMQRQMDTISKQVYSGNPPPEALGTPRVPSDNAGLAAAVDERMSSLEGGMRQLNNRMDEQDYAIGQLKQELALLKNDLEIRLRDLNALPSLPSASPLTANEPARAPAEEESGDDTRVSGPVPAGAVQDLPTDNAAALYDAAFQALREQKYERAEGGFKAFMQRFPENELAGNAQYWLGETFYVRGNYDEAAKVFAQAFQKYPKSTKAPDNLLKLGLSLSQTGKKQEACVTLQQMNKRFHRRQPSSSSAPTRK